MKLVTVATHSDGYFPFLLESCKRFNVTLEVLGWGQKWQGFQWKFLLMKQYISTLPDDEIVCFIDAYDVLILRPLDDLEEVFKKMSVLTNKRIIVGCDQTNNDYIHNFLLYWVFNKCQDKHLNSGTYIGYVKDIRMMLDGILELSNNPKNDDQVMMIQFCRKNPYKIFIDSDNVLFLTITTYLDKKDSNLIILNGNLLYKWTKPFILHCPGNFNMSDIILKLGYNITINERKTYDTNYTSKLLKRLLHYLYFFWNLIIGIIVIICVSLVLKKLFKNT